MNNIKDLKETRLGVAEYHLTKEEEKLSAVPMILGHTVIEGGRTLPGILLKQPLKDRKKYEGVITDSPMEAAPQRRMGRGCIPGNRI